MPNPINIDKNHTSTPIFEVGVAILEQMILPVQIVKPAQKETPISALSSTVLKGKSAYEMALEYGFIGSEKQWIESLKGKDGQNAKQTRVTLSPFAELYRAGQPYRASAVVSVLDGVKDITESLHRSCFSWQRVSANPKGDPTWNLLHDGIGPKLELTEEDIVGDTQIYVYIKDNNNNNIQTTRII